MLYVTNIGSNTVSVVNTIGNTVVATIPVGNHPTLVEPNSNTNMVYVTNSASNTVSVINGTTNTVMAIIPVGNSPNGIGVNPLTNKIYVANFFANTVSVIDGFSNTVTTTIPVGLFPGAVHVDPNTNKIFVTNFSGNSVSVIDGFTNNVINTIPVGASPTGLQIDTNNNKLYVSNSGSGTVSVIDLSIGLVTNTIPVGISPFPVNVNLNTNRLYVGNLLSNNVMVIDVSPGSLTENTVIATIPVGLGPASLVINPDVPNPVRDPSKDVKIGGQKIQCAYIANHPHLSKFAVGGIITVLAILGHGGSSYVPPSLDLSGLAAAQGALPDNIKQQVLNHDPYKPMVPSSDKSFDFPFSIDGGGFVLAGLTNTIATQTEKTGTPADIKLNLLSSLSLQHIALYTNLRGNARDIDKSDTYIIYEKGQPLQIVDPHGYFADVKFDLTKTGYKNTIVYKITFAKPMEKSDIDLRVWDEIRAPSDNRILDAWQVEPSSTTAPSQTAPVTTPSITTPPATTTPATTPPIQNTAPVSENTPDLMPAIKDWGGYSPTSISDSKLLSDMGVKGQHIPSWVMKTTKWIVDGEISQQEFVNMITYLSENGMTK
jgi:YVTN family beta-propeller protein